MQFGLGGEAGFLSTARRHVANSIGSYKTRSKTIETLQYDEADFQIFNTPYFPLRSILIIA